MYRYKATVLNVVDGDTVDLLVDVGFHISAKHRFRLAGIDAWEMRGPEKDKGRKAKEFLIYVLGYANIEIESGKEKGVYGRWICTIWTEDGINVNELLVEKGHAIRKEY